MVPPNSTGRSNMKSSSSPVLGSSSIPKSSYVTMLQSDGSTKLKLSSSYLVKSKTWLHLLIFCKVIPSSLTNSPSKLAFSAWECKRPYLKLNGANVNFEELSMIGSFGVNNYNSVSVRSRHLNCEQATVILQFEESRKKIDALTGPTKKVQLWHLSTESSAM